MWWFTLLLKGNLFPSPHPTLATLLKHSHIPISYRVIDSINILSNSHSFWFPDPGLLLSLTKFLRRIRWLGLVWTKGQILPLARKTHRHLSEVSWEETIKQVGETNFMTLFNGKCLLHLFLANFSGADKTQEETSYKGHSIFHDFWCVYSFPWLYHAWILIFKLKCFFCCTQGFQNTLNAVHWTSYQNNILSVHKSAENKDFCGMYERKCVKYVYVG